jgi:hypothetical protein
MKGGGFVPTLISELRARLSEIEAERVAITRALRVLEPEPPHRRTRPLDVLLIERLRISQGSRASFLALDLNVDIAVVTAALHLLERNGEVARAGMGWELTGAARQ